MAKDFTGATTTKGGYTARNVKWNNVAGAYLGEVTDPLWKREGREFTAASWSKSGRCRNQTRPEIDLILPQ